MRPGGAPLGKVAPSPAARAKDDRGFATIWAVGLTLAMIALVGLVVDGGNVLRARADVHSSAASAARVGAQQLDLPGMLDEEGEPDANRVRLQHGQAREAARDYLRARGFADDQISFPTPESVDRFTVLLADEVRMQILLWGGDDPSIRVRMPATARAAET